VDESCSMRLRTASAASLVASRALIAIDLMVSETISASVTVTPTLNPLRHLPYSLPCGGVSNLYLQPSEDDRHCDWLSGHSSVSSTYLKMIEWLDWEVTSRLSAHTRGPALGINLPNQPGASGVSTELSAHT